jgi:hypothetical protein
MRNIDRFVVIEGEENDKKSGMRTAPVENQCLIRSSDLKSVEDTIEMSHRGLIDVM